MAARKKIGLLFLYDASWAGGMYYVLNTLKALNVLPDAQKPEVIVFYASPVTRATVEELSYPYIKFLPLRKRLSLFHRVLRQAMMLLYGKDYKYNVQYARSTVDFLFPCDYNTQYLITGSLSKLRTIYWIPDFQHKHLPHFFTAEEIDARDKSINEIARLNAKLVVSSNDAKNDFVRFYSPHNVTVQVIPFATVLPRYEQLDIDVLRRKYELGSQYFISPNQFWKHKNHLIILKAVALLKNKGYNYQVVFTGKEQDYRNPDYVESIKQIVKDQGIEQNIRFLGFIDRTEQLQLMKHAIAVVQPSLFEGWSTVVEDSKAMDQTLILSDLNVHREQCGSNALFFDPTNEHQLAEYLERSLVERVKFPPNHYDRKILAYAENILRL